MNVLDPAGPQAALIAAETWYLLAVMSAVREGEQLGWPA